MSVQPISRDDSLRLAEAIDAHFEESFNYIPGPSLASKLADFIVEWSARESARQRERREQRTAIVVQSVIERLRAAVRRIPPWTPKA